VFFRGAGGDRTLDLILVKIRVVFAIKLKSGIEIFFKEVRFEDEVLRV
jgi:hypothetical protein